MKRHNLIILLFVLCFTSIVGYGSEEKKRIIIGLKGGAFTIDNENSLNIFSLGGSVGFILPFDNRYFEVALEGDFNLGHFGGDYVSGYPGNRSHIRTFGSYVVVSTIPSNEIYFKGKIGVSHETVLETIEDVETPYREIGSSFGIGVGYNASDNVNVEAEYTITHSDMKFLSFGFRFFL